MAEKILKGIKFPGLEDTYIIPEVDSSLTVSGSSADAKVVGERLTNVESLVGDKTVSQQISSAINGLATETYVNERVLETESYVDTKVASIVDSAPETLNTLNELADALGEDPNFATTVATQIGEIKEKVENKRVVDFKVRGKGNFADGISPVDRALISTARACRTAFIPADNITVEYTLDNGETWQDCGLTDVQKAKLFDMNGNYNLPLSFGEEVAAGHGVRVTANLNDRYFTADTIYVYTSSATHDYTCELQGEYYDSEGLEEFTTISEATEIDGWTGANEIFFTTGYTAKLFGSYNRTDCANKIRFIFMINKAASNYLTTKPTISDIRLYGATGIYFANNMMKNDVIYSWDENQNVIFPKTIKAKELLSEQVTGSDAHPVYFDGTGAAPIKYDLSEHDTILDRLRTLTGDTVVHDNAIDGAELEVWTDITPVRESEGTPSVDNPIPFVIHDNIILHHSGYNLLDQTKITESPSTVGSLTGATITSEYIDITRRTEYDYFTIPIYVEKGIKYTAWAECEVYDRKDGTGITKISLGSSSFETNSACIFADSNGTYYMVYNFTAPESGAFKLGFNANWGSIIPAKVKAKIMLVEGTYNLNTIPTFEPFQGNVYTTEDLVYSEPFVAGRFTWNTGEMILTHGLIESYAGETVSEGWESSTGELSEGAQVIYPLEEPIIYNFEPIEILALNGQNYLYSIHGETSVKQDYVKIDRSLSKNGMAADAKVVGDEVEHLYSVIDTLTIELQDLRALIMELELKLQG